MNRICWCVLLALLVGLIPAAVSADVELRGDIGAATIRVEGEVSGVQYDGYSVFCNHDGYALVSVFDAYEHDSLTIYGDTGAYTVEVAVDAEANPIALTEAIPEAPQVVATDDDSGQSVTDMNRDSFLANIDWTGQDTWLWT